jgi:RND family efflux transporter MFP subunit
LSTPVAGAVQQIHFKEGDYVEAGAVILELDKALEELEVSRRRSVFESRAELEAAEHRATVLQADYESTRRLFEKSQSVSRDEVDKRELEFKLAVGERDRLTAAKERERIELEIARQQLAYRKIVAPFAGVITDLRVDLGVACEPRQPVVRLVELKQIYFVADVTPGLTTGLKPGSAVKLLIDVAPGQREVAGTVEYLAPVVDAGSGLRRVKIIFDNPGSEIAPGAVGRLVLD